MSELQFANAMVALYTATGILCVGRKALPLAVVMALGWWVIGGIAVLTS